MQKEIKKDISLSRTPDKVKPKVIQRRSKSSLSIGIGTVSELKQEEISSLKAKQNVVLNDIADKEPTKSKSFKADEKQTEELIRAGRKGAAHAIRTSKALGLTITFMEDGILYREKPDGSKEIISTEGKKSALKLKKGMVLHAKK